MTEDINKVAITHPMVEAVVEVAIEIAAMEDNPIVMALTDTIVNLK